MDYRKAISLDMRHRTVCVCVCVCVQVYVVELIESVEVCVEKNVHKRTKEEIEKVRY